MKKYYAILNADFRYMRNLNRPTSFEILTIETDDMEHAVEIAESRYIHRKFEIFVKKNDADNYLESIMTSWMQIKQWFGSYADDLEVKKYNQSALSKPPSPDDSKPAQLYTAGSFLDAQLFIKGVYDDDPEIVRKSIKNTDKINELYFRDVPLLHFASCLGSVNVIKALIAEGAKCEIEYSGGNKAPVIAMLSCGTNAEPVLAAFLDAGVDPNMRGYQQNSLLIEASFSGKTSCVRLLLERGADINAVNIKGNSPLISAAKNGFKDTVELLLEKGADTAIMGRSMPMESEVRAPFGEIYVNGQKMFESNDSAGSSAAMMAAKRKFYEIARLINALSCIKGPRDRKLIESITYKNSETIKQFVENETLTPSQGLICCACNMHLGSVKLMIAKGADNLKEAFDALLNSGEPPERDKENAMRVLQYLELLSKKKLLN